MAALGIDTGAYATKAATEHGSALVPLSMRRHPAGDPGALDTSVTLLPSGVVAGDLRTEIVRPGDAEAGLADDVVCHYMAKRAYRQFAEEQGGASPDAACVALDGADGQAFLACSRALKFLDSRIRTIPVSEALAAWIEFLGASRCGHASGKQASAHVVLDWGYRGLRLFGVDLEQNRSVSLGDETALGIRNLLAADIEHYNEDRVFLASLGVQRYLPALKVCDAVGLLQAPCAYVARGGHHAGAAGLADALARRAASDLTRVSDRLKAHARDVRLPLKVWLCGGALKLPALETCLTTRLQPGGVQACVAHAPHLGAAFGAALRASKLEDGAAKPAEPAQIGLATRKGQEFQPLLTLGEDCTRDWRNPLRRPDSGRLVLDVQVGFPRRGAGVAGLARIAIDEHELGVQWPETVVVVLAGTGDDWLSVKLEATSGEVLYRDWLALGMHSQDLRLGAGEHDAKHPFSRASLFRHSLLLPA
jgi:hypothetical protein